MSFHVNYHEIRDKDESVKNKEELCKVNVANSWAHVLALWNQLGVGTSGIHLQK